MNGNLNLHILTLPAVLDQPLAARSRSRMCLELGMGRTSCNCSLEFGNQSRDWRGPIGHTSAIAEALGFSLGNWVWRLLVTWEQGQVATYL